MFQTAYTFGRFNIPHRGHLALLEEMRSLGHNVVVGVSTAEGNAPLGMRLAYLRKLAPWATFIPVNSIFSLPTSEDVVVFGQDQEHLADAISDYSGCSTFLLQRSLKAPSSTACRKAFRQQDILSLVELIPSKLIEEAESLWLTSIFP